MWRDSATLLDILSAARSIVDFRGSSDEAAFLADLKTQSAVLHQLLIMGEAAKRLSEEFRSSHPEIPWKAIAGMRDKLIHAYQNVELKETWRVVSVEIPRLIDLITPLVPNG